MQYDEFINRVKQQANLDTENEAVQSTQAVLETLGERLDRKVRESTEANLPNELKSYLQARKENPDKYTITEFYNRVGARAGLQYYDAAERTWNVLDVLKEAIPPTDLKKIEDSLPGEYGALFGKDTPDKQRPRP